MEGRNTKVPEGSRGRQLAEVPEESGAIGTGRMASCRRAALRKALNLYLVTDRSWLAGESLESRVAEALAGGVTFIQLREKNLSSACFVETARILKRMAESYGVPFVVNDDVAVACAVEADGVHVGQTDCAAVDARAAIGSDRILGVSVQTVEQALQAVRDGADYLGVGTMFPTRTKKDAEVVSIEMLASICKAVAVPVVAIGGIHAGNIECLTGTGIAGVAVISAILAEPDSREAARVLAGMSIPLFR